VGRVTRSPLSTQRASAGANPPAWPKSIIERQMLLAIGGQHGEGKSDDGARGGEKLLTPGDRFQGRGDHLHDLQGR